MIAGIALLALALAAAIVPSGHCVTLLLAGGDPDCCCAADHAEAGHESGCGCLKHRQSCCYVLSSSICNHNDAGMDSTAAFAPTFVDVIPAISHEALPAPARADDVSPPGGPPLFIRHASILI